MPDNISIDQNEKTFARLVSVQAFGKVVVNHCGQMCNCPQTVMPFNAGKLVKKCFRKPPNQRISIKPKRLDFYKTM